MIKIRYLLMALLSVVFISLNAVGSTEDSYSLSKEVNQAILENNVREFLRDNEGLLKINENELKTIRIVNYNDEWNVKFGQEYNRIKVYNSKVIVNVKDNNIVKIKSNF